MFGLDVRAFGATFLVVVPLVGPGRQLSHKFEQGVACLSATHAQNSVSVCVIEWCTEAIFVTQQAFDLVRCARAGVARTGDTVYAFTCAGGLNLATKSM